ncbi:MAG TPA: hypothetical protein VGJ60_19300 [Chloroflexota bacterium]
MLLVPFAITSTKAWVCRMGFTRWPRLHQLAYVAGVLAAIHFIWRVKIDVCQPVTTRLHCACCWLCEWCCGWRVAALGPRQPDATNVVS